MAVQERIVAIPLRGALMRVIGPIDEPGFMGGRIDVDPGPVIAGNQEAFTDAGIGQFVLLGVREVKQTR